MKQIPTSANYAKNSEQPVGDGELPCVVCGKPTKKSTAAWVTVINGGSHLAENADEATRVDGGYCGAFPIGRECLRKHPELKACTMIQY